MTREEALRIWLPVIKMGVESMQECSEAVDMAIKALEQEPCDDCISREKVNDTIKEWLSNQLNSDIQFDLLLSIEHLPPVTPKSKTGHWIWDYGYATCNQCGYTRDSKDNEGQDIPDNYCPNCGAQMKERGDENNGRISYL